MIDGNRNTNSESQSASSGAIFKPSGIPGSFMGRFPPERHLSLQKCTGLSPPARIQSPGLRLSTSWYRGSFKAFHLSPLQSRRQYTTQSLLNLSSRWTLNLFRFRPFLSVLYDIYQRYSKRGSCKLT